MEQFHLTAGNFVAAEATDRWQPLPARPTEGILRASLDSWRNKHPWRVAADSSVLAVFESGIDQRFWDVLKSDIPESKVSVLYDSGQFRFAREGEKRSNLDQQGGAMGLNRLRYHGEHIGKWLDAGTLAYDATGDQRIGQALTNAVARLIRSQKPDGYFGGYPPGVRFARSRIPMRRFPGTCGTPAMSSGVCSRMSSFIQTPRYATHAFGMGTYC